MSREVPEGWELHPLTDLARYINGRAFKPEDWVSSGLPIIRIANMTNPDAAFNFYEGEDIDDGHLIQPGDILFSWSATLSIQKWTRATGVLNQHIFKVVPAESVQPDWLLYVLQNEVERLADQSHGSTMKHIKKGVLKTHHVGVPPLHEQRRIAEILASADEAIAATRAVIEQTRKVKQGVLERLLTKGIGHTRFKQTEIGEIPEGWTVATLAEAGVAILDGDRGKEYPKAEDYQEEGYCLFLSAKNVTRSGFVFDECQFLSEEKHLKLRNGLLQRSDIVVTTRGTIGNFAFYGPDIEFDCLRINSGMALMRSIRSQMHPNFLFILTASQLIDDQLKRRVFGSAQPQLTLDILRKLVVPVPPEAEQVSIAAQANDLLEIERHQRVQLTAIERFKSALMSDLLTGRRRVTDALPLAAE